MMYLEYEPIISVSFKHGGHLSVNDNFNTPVHGPIRVTSIEIDGSKSPYVEIHSNDDVIAIIPCEEIKIYYPDLKSRRRN